jgi:outer membrane protein OmpA-like peptidoglycan-associated protein
LGYTAAPMRLLRYAALVAAVVIAAGTAARAQSGFDGERLAPAAGAAGGVFVERPVVPFHLGYGFGLFLHFADDAVVVRGAAGGAGVTTLGTPLDGAVSADLLASLGLFNFLEVAVHLPVRLYYTGDGSAAPLIASRGLGDLRLVPKAAFGRGGSAALGWAFGAAVPVTLPTGDDLALRGSAGVTVEPRLLAGLYAGRLAVVANLGWRFRRNASFSPGDELTFGLAGTYTLPVAYDGLDLHAELSGGWLPSVSGRAQIDLPLEAIGGVIFRPHPRFSLYAMAGAGITNGLAVPDFRLLAGARYAFDLPGKGGQRDSDGDGIVDSQDTCPGEPEDRDGFEDQDGCPDLDNDKDGIDDDHDECPDDPEEKGGDGDGCPDKARVTVRNGKLIVFGKVQFAVGSDNILPKSEQLVDEMAKALKEHPEIKRIEIQGHTDSTGDDFFNLKLGQARAESCKRALIKRGVPPARIVAKGYGEQMPAAPNDTPAGRAKNRRVEFVILDQ